MNNIPLPVSEAHSLILERVGPLESQLLPHAEVLGRVLAQSITSPLDLPSFANSAMDGFALVAADLEHAPQTLRLLETIGAGEVASHTVQRGTCIKIMTGAPLPRGADCVLMREETREFNGQVEFHETARTGQNVRPQGDDVREGEVVFQAGTPISAAGHAMLASLGCARVEVFRRPRVALVVTGKELVDVDAPLLPGQIRDSNSWALRALVAQCGAEVASVTRTGDDVSEVEAVLRAASQNADCVVTSGGVSVGDFDPIRDVLLKCAQVHFWKVAMRPGKPLMFASLEEKPVFALPGNPVSVMIGFEEFVRPALFGMAGRRAWKRIEVEARLQGDLHSPPDRTEFVRAHLKRQSEGFLALGTGDQGSGRLSSMVRANALLEIPSDTTFLPAGSPVRAKLLEDAAFEDGAL
jgi:molybdopterin molybdotransferase